MALLGATTDLERAGDESKKIALYARSIFAAGRPLLARVGELWPLAHLVRNMLHEALVGIEALDPRSAAALMRRDLEANEGLRSVLRRLARIMVEDPRTISASWTSCSSPSRSSASATTPRTSASTWCLRRWERMCATPACRSWKDWYRDRSIC